MRTPCPGIPRARSLAPPLLALVALLSAGCSSRPPIETVPEVDLERFMGDWYVLAHLPVGVERDAHNAVESYRLGRGGRIETTYAFRRGGFEGPLKVLTPVGFVRDRESRAVWGMQFVWPFRAEFRIAHLDADYGETIIARTRRDYVWIMAREPQLPPGRLEALEAEAVRMGYPAEAIRRVPQRWPDPEHPVSARRSDD